MVAKAGISGDAGREDGISGDARGGKAPQALVPPRRGIQCLHPPFRVKDSQTSFQDPRLFSRGARKSASSALLLPPPPSLLPRSGAGLRQFGSRYVDVDRRATDQEAPQMMPRRESSP